MCSAGAARRCRGARASRSPRAPTCASASSRRFGARSEDGSRGADGRLDVLARFLLDPFRQSRWGFSAGGGVSLRADVAAIACGRTSSWRSTSRARARRADSRRRSRSGFGGGVRAGVGTALERALGAVVDLVSRWSRRTMRRATRAAIADSGRRRRRGSLCCSVSRGGAEPRRRAHRRLQLRRPETGSPRRSPRRLGLRSTRTTQWGGLTSLSAASRVLSSCPGAAASPRRSSNSASARDSTRSGVDPLDPCVPCHP